MKIKDVKLKLKEFIISNLKKFDLTKYKIKVELKRLSSLDNTEIAYTCDIYIIKNDYILKINYHNIKFVSFRIYSKKDLIVVRGAPDILYRGYKFYSLDEIMKVLDNDFFKIALKLYKSKDKISKKIENFINLI